MKSALKTPALTASRQTVLDMIRHSKKPIGAYAILEKLKKTQPNAAPPTVYRALEYLVKNHLAHRIEKLNAYVACDHAHDHAAQFLVCTGCGATHEIDATDLRKTTDKIAKKLGFTVEQTIVEMLGHCRKCDHHPR